MMINIKRTICLLICISFSSPKFLAQNALEDIPKPDLEKELASFEILDGFEINLFAATPMIEKPTQINFDSKGRLWLCGSHIYPQLNVNEEASDRIVILEDTDKDGVADKSSIFYDKLIIPGGILPDNQGGAYVANGDKLLHLSDVDGDGIADKSEVLLTGFGTEDTHHTLHRLGWGPGGKMYMLQGYYIASNVETAYGPRHLNGGGLWSYDVDTRRLEIFTKGYTNPWGHAINYWGQSFESDGAGNGFGHSFPNSVFRASPGETLALPELTPDRPKASGIEIISGKHFPPSWTGDVITNDFRAHITDRYSLTENESSYRAKLKPTFLRSSHKSFRPIDVKMGPDGALYIADWYSPIIQHGEVDFRDKRRDQQHGRIWRITAKGRPLLEIPKYDQASINELLDLLKSRANWERILAKQTLKKRESSEVMLALDKWLADLNPLEADYDHHRLEALWTVQTLGEVNTDLLKNVLQSKSSGARSAAARVLYYWNDSVPEALDLLETAIKDSNPSVRREAITSLSQFKTAKAFDIALLGYREKMDPSYSFALRQTSRILSKYWLTSLHTDDLGPKSNHNDLIFALKATEDPRATKPLIDFFKKSSIPDPSILEAIGHSANTEELNFLTDIASKPNYLLAGAAGKGLLVAAKDREVFPSQKITKAIQNLFSSPNESDHTTACGLVGHWKSDEFIGQVKEKLRKTNATYDLKKNAAQALAQFGTKDVSDFLVQSINEDISINTTKLAIYSLVQFDLETGIEAIANVFNKEIDNATIQYLIRQIFRKDGAFRALSSALEEKTIDPKTAERAARYVRIAGREGTEELIASIAKAGNIMVTIPQSNNGQRTQDLITKLKDGNARNGKVIYYRPELACISCHKVNGVGFSDIGPDLGSIGASAPLDYIVESITEPSKKIKEGYKSSSITTKNGDFYSGSIIFEDTNKIIIKSSAGEEVSILKNKIESRETSKVSMMPEGLTETLSEEELVDLLKYLAELGKSQ